jgi:hypothetical protein
MIRKSVRRISDKIMRKQLKTNLRVPATRSHLLQSVRPSNIEGRRECRVPGRTHARLACHPHPLHPASQSSRRVRPFIETGRWIIWPCLRKTEIKSFGTGLYKSELLRICAIDLPDGAGVDTLHVTAAAITFPAQQGAPSVGTATATHTLFRDGKRSNGKTYPHDTRR